MSVWIWLKTLFLGWSRRRRLELLSQAVECHRDVLTVASAQLRDADSQVERAVSELGANFGRMVERAREGASEAARLLGSDGAAMNGVDALLGSSRSTLEEVMGRIAGDGEICRGLTGKLRALEHDMSKIQGALEAVDRISFGNTILALNAKIEAAHMGDRGQGFEIVAQELWLQSRRSVEITESIRSTITQLAGDAKSVAAEIGALACADGPGVTVLQKRVSEAMDRLDQMHNEAQRTVVASGARSDALAAEISAAVQSMQFQDRVSQQIGHVIGALEAMQSAISAPGESSGSAARSLAERYTMQTERLTHALATGDNLKTQEESADVEFF